MHFIWPKFFNSANSTYLFLLICIIRPRGNKARAKSGYTIICFTINGPLKMLPRNFWYFHCSDFKMTLHENLMKKATIFELLPNFHCGEKYYVLVAVGSKTETSQFKGKIKHIKNVKNLKIT